MSVFTYLAADCPLEERKNPHYKLLSVNEALALKIEVPQELLDSDVDRDAPDSVMCSDTEIVIDMARNKVDDGGFNDDFAIYRTEKTWDDIYTEKEYLAYLEWGQFTPGRAVQVIEYIRRQLQCTDEVELWHTWLGCEYRPKIHKAKINIDELTAVDIKELEDTSVWKEPYTQYCIVITSR